MEQAGARGQLAVFEAVNATLKEFYIGVTSLAIEEIESSHRQQPPASIAHWQPDQDISYRCAQGGLAPKEGAAFLSDYAYTIGRIGWKAIVAS